MGQRPPRRTPCSEAPPPGPPDKLLGEEPSTGRRDGVQQETAGTPGRGRRWPKRRRAGKRQGDGRAERLGRSGKIPQACPGRAPPAHSRGQTPRGPQAGGWATRQSRLRGAGRSRAACGVLPPRPGGGRPDWRPRAPPPSPPPRGGPRAPPPRWPARLGPKSAFGRAARVVGRPGPLLASPRPAPLTRVPASPPPRPRPRSALALAAARHGRPRNEWNVP